MTNYDKQPLLYDNRYNTILQLTMTTNKEAGVEVELAGPPVLFPNEDEDPSIVEGGGRENVITKQQQTTKYSKTIGKVAILFLAVFAVFIAIGYGFGYGVNEKIISNHNKAAAVSSAKNGNFETYDLPTSAKAAKSGGGGSAKSAKSTGPAGTKSRRQR